MLYEQTAVAQCGTPANTYGANNIWIGYAYDNTSFTNSAYRGTITEGSTASPNFDEDFGGGNGSFNTDRCPVNKETFSVRFRLRKTFPEGRYRFTIGADDGVRFSLNGGGNNWVINEWRQQAYTEFTYEVNLNGTQESLMVIEYYENADLNRVSFKVEKLCTISGSQTAYGTNNTWYGYVYDGINFNDYKGRITAGSPENPYFDQDFGGDNVVLNTNQCSTQTETFSVRYKLQKNFQDGIYIFTVGGDDGYRLSLDGGNNWVINNWGDHAYMYGSYTTRLNGMVNMVLEFYENAGANRVSFDIGVTLPINLLQFDGQLNSNRNAATLNWSVTRESTEDHFVVERSGNGSQFGTLAKRYPSSASTTDKGREYSYTDTSPLPGNSWYRLKMVDQDGDTRFSPIVHVSTPPAHQIRLYPTLVDQQRQLFVQADQSRQNLLITVSSAVGQKIVEKNTGPVGNGQVSTIALPAALAGGTYIVQISSGSELLHKQLILVK